jgi:hypothetical protein
MQLKNLFPGQQDNEQIYLVVREHWFIFFVKVLVWFVFIVILFAFDYFAKRYVPKLLDEPYVLYVNVIKNIFLAYVVYTLLLLWVLYRLSYQVVTNERVVDVLQSSIFHHSVAELHLHNIEDVTAETKGLFGTMIGYGDIYIQTAGAHERFVFNNVPEADKVSKLILNLYDKEQELRHSGPPEAE